MRDDGIPIRSTTRRHRGGGHWPLVVGGIALLLTFGGLGCEIAGTVARKKAYAEKSSLEKFVQPDNKFHVLDESGSALLLAGLIGMGLGIAVAGCGWAYFGAADGVWVLRVATVLSLLVMLVGCNVCCIGSMPTANG